MSRLERLKAGATRFGARMAEYRQRAEAEREERDQRHRDRTLAEAPP
ncbi:hypothetical protein H3146_24955, partial [Streptomyces sp. OF3]|nr:hypothetical protein [Streptomyces alkaliterrae]